MYAGAAYLVPSGPNEKKHLHVVLVNPNSFGMVIWVCACSVKSGIYYDDSCILQANSHEFIKSKSFVAYNFTSSVHSEHIRKMVEKHYYIKQPDVTFDILESICEGLKSTEEAPKGVRRSFLEWPDDK